jgi:hypothetical protein
VKLLGIAALFALAICGCGGAERVIAWNQNTRLKIPQTAPNVPPIPRHAHFCIPPQVRLQSDGSQGVNPFETVYYFSARNHGRRGCAIGGHPTVVVLSSGSGPVAVGETGDGLVTPGYPAGGPLWGLKPGEVARVIVDVDNSCDPAAGNRRSTARLLLRLPKSGRGGVRFSVAGCVSGIAVNPTPLMPPELESRPADTRIDALRAEIEGRPEATPGSNLVYRVRLTNISKGAVGFPNCPDVEQQIARLPTIITALNCHAVGTVSPGGSIAFEMHLNLAPGVRPGRYRLRWSLENIDDLDHALNAYAEIDVR